MQAKENMGTIGSAAMRFAAVLVALALGMTMMSVTPLFAEDAHAAVTAGKVKTTANTVKAPQYWVYNNARYYSYAAYQAAVKAGKSTKAPQYWMLNNVRYYSYSAYQAALKKMGKAKPGRNVSVVANTVKAPTIYLYAGHKFYSYGAYQSYLKAIGKRR